MGGQIKSPGTLRSVFLTPTNLIRSYCLLCQHLLHRKCEECKICSAHAESVRCEKTTAHGDLPHRRSVCTGGCWCCAPQPPAASPRTRERPRQEMSRRGGKFPLRSPAQTVHTFWPCEVTDEKHSFTNLAPFPAAPCTPASSPHIPADPVEQIISPIV